jgi:predicted amidohydrolase
MTPKEKAYELIEKHLKVYNIEPIAVESAFVSVDEVISSHIIDGIIDYDVHIYWDSVIQEIEIYLQKWERNEL